MLQVKPWSAEKNYATMRFVSDCGWFFAIFSSTSCQLDNA
jgi:hypothetical protein